MSALSIDDSYVRVIMPRDEAHPDRGYKQSKCCCFAILQKAWNMFFSSGVPTQRELLAQIQQAHEKFLKNSIKDP